VPTYYREFWAVKDVSFEIKKGETVGIIGRNGSGKSTLLQLICGTLSPSGGRVSTTGRFAALLELGSGFNPEFSGRENVYLNSALYGLSPQEIDARFDSIVEFSEIGDFIDQPVKTYSSGMFVRLAFAVVAHVDADIIIIDEALAVGDIRFQNKCQRKLEEFRKSGCSILFVSHSPGVIEAFCDHAIWLEGGRLHGAGKPAQLVRDYVNVMVHGLVQPADRSKDAKEATPYGGAAAPAAREWHWVQLGSQHNVRHVSRARIQAVRVRFNGEIGATVIEPAPTCLEVEARIAVTDTVLRPLVAVGVFNHLNEPIIHINTFNLNAMPDSVDGGLTVVMKATLDLPPLRPGEYLVSVGLDEGEPGSNEVLSHAYGAWAFRVKAPPDRKCQGGYIQIINAHLSLVTEEAVE
jgi:lipopolysaccharide transport system ATP-binding protein